MGVIKTQKDTLNFEDFRLLAYTFMKQNSTLNIIINFQT